MLKLSIIIPVYNVARFLSKCLDSCLQQDLPYDEYEIVVVNDGSTDNSVSIVEEYTKKYFNIRLINRLNGGLSAARNTGLKEAKGEYVWFIDSDDWIEKNCLSILMEKLIVGSLDVLCINLQLCFDDGRIIPYIVEHTENEKIYNGCDFICNVTMPPAAVCGVYRRSFLINNGFHFLEGVLHEDMEFTPRVYSKAERILFYDCPIYNYYQRQGSIMKSVRNVKRCRDLLIICDHLYDFTLKNFQKGTPVYDCLMDKIAFTFSQSVYFHSSEAFSLKVFKTKPYYPVWISMKSSLGQRIKYELLNFSLSLYKYIQRIQQIIK